MKQKTCDRAMRTFVYAYPYVNKLFLKTVILQICNNSRGNG